MILKKELGKRIQQLRKSKKMTQEALAEIIDIDPKNVSKIENGNHYPSAETLVAIAKALDVEIFELFVFKDSLPYESMKQDIIDSLNCDKNILYHYRMLKGL